MEEMIYLCTKKIHTMISTESLVNARFEHFTDDLQKSILEEGRVIEVEEGDVLIRSGDPIRNTMLVVDGRIKIYREDEDGNEYLLYYLEPGSACAISIMCALQNEESKITAIAETHATLIAIPFEFIGKWMEIYPSWSAFIIRTYRARFDELLLTIDHIAFRKMDERLVFYLKQKTEGRGNQIATSHQEIANDLNSAREVISRLLKKLEQMGAIKLERNLIHIINLENV